MKDLSLTSANRRRLLLGLAAASCAPSLVGATDSRPRAVELIVPSGAGSGLDRAGRAIHHLLERRQLVGGGSIVVNKPGAGGSVAYAYMNQHPGKGTMVAVGSPGLVTNKLMGIGTIDFRDLTPIARLYSENIVFMVRHDSAIRDGRGLLARVRADPQSVKFGIATALGGANHIAAASALQAAGLDIQKALNVVYKSGADAMFALLGGHVDVVPVAAPVAAPQLQAGKVRVIAVSSPKRLGGPLADVPTWREQGVDAVYTSWRVMVGPKGMSGEDAAHWERVFAAMTSTPEWQAEAEKNLWLSDYLDTRATRRFLEDELRQHRALLAALGLEK